jgi:pimeloyl-ACP methyl ester carboxylesterase
MPVKSHHEFGDFANKMPDRRFFILTTLAGLTLSSRASVTSLSNRQSRELKAQQVNGLEILQASPSTVTGKPRILLIPGAYHGAWAFENNLLPFFANAGYEVFSMSLRGHGASSGGHQVLEAGFDDYVADVETVIQHLGGALIIIGHSLGGLLARRVLERQNIRAAVLLAAPTPQSMQQGAFKLLFNFPWAITKFILSGDPDTIYRDQEVVRKLLFNGARDEASENALHRILLEKESRKIVKEVQSLKFKPIKLPVLAMVGTADLGVPVEAAHEAAGYYSGTVKLIQDAAHEFFLMPGWETSARCITDWLANQGL